VKRAAFLVVLAMVVACGGGDDDADICSVPDGPGFDPEGPMCERLSSYHLFEDANAQEPAPGLVPFALNTALFSDYATKYRFIYVPDGETLLWSDDEAFDFPVGSIIVKTFAFLADIREPDGPRDLIETRLLLHRDTGWEAASYVYDEADEEAYLKVAGDVVHAEWIDAAGEPAEDEYVVPNKNQCKNCHEDKIDTFDPLGPKARHINRDGQLEAMVDSGLLVGAPSDSTTWPKAPVFDDESTGTLEERARGWLEINCSHCHNPEGAARTSGLDLRIAQTDPFWYGICKPPVAAGLGSGGRPYGIVPGDPDQSILMYRLESTEAEIKMPELGRNLVHAEGVALIREWILSLTGECTPP
jgi:uncharacterized repeat protein (TIGR03806 family)